MPFRPPRLRSFFSALRVATPCLLCTAPGEHRLCSSCEWGLPYLARHPHRCRQCTVPLTSALAASSASDYCGTCLFEPPAFELCRAACTYEYPLDGLIHRFKYRRHLGAGRVLGDILAQHLITEREETPTEQWPEILIPVPMHWGRKLVRGFNQAELLANDLGAALNLPVQRLCRRRRRTRTQQGLSRRARRKNLRAAFAMKADSQALLSGRRVALVDDVVTTGQTVRILAELLIRSGASAVEVWAVARTPGSEPAQALQ